MHTFYAALYYLISWPEEDDVMSVVAGQMIVSPPAEELIPGAMCKVKVLRGKPLKGCGSTNKGRNEH